MNITSYHIQNVIRAYGQRVGRRKNLSTILPEGQGRSPDVISISSEAKQRQVMERLAAEIVNRVQGETQNPTLGPQIYDRLSQELGGRLDVTPDLQKESGFRFRVVDPEKGDVLKELSAKDTEELVNGIYQRMVQEAKK